MEKDRVLALLAERCEQAGSQLKWAKAHGLSQPYVSDVLNGRREPGKSILLALNLEQVTIYRPISKPSPKPEIGV